MNIPELKLAVEIVKEVLESCFESKQRNGTIAHGVGGIESTQKNYKQALQTLIDYCSEPKEENMIKKLDLPELAVCDYGDTDRIIGYIICLGKKINEIIDHLSQEKDVCHCFTPIPFLRACAYKLGSEEVCKNCGYKIIREPTKEVPEPKVELEELAVEMVLSKIETPIEESLLEFVQAKNKAIVRLKPKWTTLIAQSICSHFKLSVPSVQRIEEALQKIPSTHYHISKIGGKDYYYMNKRTIAEVVHSLLLGKE